MTYVRKALTLALCLAPISWLTAQQTATPRSFLAGVLSGLGAANIQGSSLSGNAESIAGSTDEMGSFTASCTVNGPSQLQLQLTSASRTETRQKTDGAPTGHWVDNEGTEHKMAGHNLFAPESWFCPHIVLSKFLQDSSLNIQFMGNESKNGASASHFTIAAPARDTKALSAFMAHLTETNIYLDSETLRPVALDFNIHPDNDANIDIPVEIRFSNYTSVNSVWIPFTIERYVNSTLTLKLQIQSASMTSSGSVNQ
jgi:hypothetical protein